MNILTRAQLIQWLNGLAQKQTLIAPKNVEGVLLYRPINQSTEIAWGFTRPLMSIKDVFLPPTERLLVIDKVGQQVKITETLPESTKVVFGVRPCDARGVQMLDALFLDTDPVDPYYAQRRQNTTLIGLACNEMGANCFCTSLGGAPNDSAGMDIILTELKEGFILQVLTQKGEELSRGLTLPDYSGELPESRLTQSFTLIEKKDWPAHFRDSNWERMSESCLSCRICAYVCPTCRCFAVRDEALTAPGKFERIRCWDSCAGENYRRVAGGHKPRSMKSERLRNRMMCKFFYYPEQVHLDHGAACTGCGRCIEACPVNIDITEVLQELGRQA